MSGIMSVLFAAITMDHYTSWNLTPHLVPVSNSVFEMLAEVAEGFVFLLLGMAVFTVEHDYRGNIALTVVLCLVARLVTMFPLSFLLNLVRKHKISPRQQVIMYLSGIRGAVAFALALEVDDPVVGRQFVSTTLVVVFTTTLLFGSTTYPIMRWLKMHAKEDEQAAGPETLAEASNHWFLRLDNKYLKPTLRVKHWQSREKFRKEEVAPVNNDIPLSRPRATSGFNASLADNDALQHPTAGPHDSAIGVDDTSVGW